MSTQTHEHVDLLQQWMVTPENDVAVKEAADIAKQLRKRVDKWSNFVTAHKAKRAERFAEVPYVCFA